MQPDSDTRFHSIESKIFLLFHLFSNTIQKYKHLHLYLSKYCYIYLYLQIRGNSSPDQSAYTL